jgi:hypothetical protein
VRILPQGFLEPLLDIAFLTTVRERLGGWPGVAPLVTGVRRLSRWLDDALLNHVVPGDLRVAMKFSAFRPAPRVSGSHPVEQRPRGTA